MINTRVPDQFRNVKLTLIDCLIERVSKFNCLDTYEEWALTSSWKVWSRASVSR